MDPFESEFCLVWWKMLVNNYNLNCSDNLDCFQTKFEGNLIRIYIVLSILSALGFVGNFLRWVIFISKYLFLLFCTFLYLCFFSSYYIFSVIRQDQNKKFIECVKIYILSSLIFSANALIGFIFWLVDTETLYQNINFTFSLFPLSRFVNFYCYFVMNFGTFLFTFGGYMELYIAFQRVQAFKTNWTYLRETPVSNNYFV